MGILLNKIKSLAERWKQRNERIDLILDTTLIDLQELAELIETLQDDADVTKHILETIRTRQEEFGVKIKELDDLIKKAKKGFWGRLIFGGE